MEFYKKQSVVLVGIGGYGECYFEQMLQKSESYGARLVGCVDPLIKSCDKVDRLQKLGIGLYSSLDEFYKKQKADLAVISSPIQYHYQQTINAILSGSNVLCEKPIAGSVQEALEMHKVAKENQRFVAIGYQLSFSPVNLEIKFDILSGMYGRPVRFKTFVCWPRARSYYQRNNWAGRIKNDEGQWILDSPVSNATAHYLHNMLFMAGSEISKSVFPNRMEVELYRVKPCENYDTAAMRIFTETGVELLFLTTHSCKNHLGPVCELEFEKGKIQFYYQKNILTGFTADGHTKDYGNLLIDDMQKLWICIESTRQEKSIPCDIQTALPHLICVNSAQHSVIHDAPKEFIKQTGQDDPLIYINNIEGAFQECFEKNVMPSELGKLNWASASGKIDCCGIVTPE